MVNMPKLTEFEESYYKWEGKYELMDPEKFYGNMPDIEDNKPPENTP